MIRNFMIKHIFLLVLLVIGFSSFAFSQNTENAKIEKEITVCPVKLIAKAAEFRFSYRYVVKTDEDGLVIKITQLGKDDVPKFIKDEDFVSCIESWKLNPSKDYFIAIYVGTIFTNRYKNYISISSKTETIKIIVPGIGETLTIEEKKKQ